jgi:hypothetical protein
MDLPMPNFRELSYIAVIVYSIATMATIVFLIRFGHEFRLLEVILVVFVGCLLAAPIMDSFKLNKDGFEFKSITKEALEKTTESLTKYDIAIKGLNDSILKLNEAVADLQGEENTETDTAKIKEQLTANNAIRAQGTEAILDVQRILKRWN